MAQNQNEKPVRLVATAVVKNQPAYVESKVSFIIKNFILAPSGPTLTYQYGKEITAELKQGSQQSYDYELLNELSGEELATDLTIRRAFINFTKLTDQLSSETKFNLKISVYGVSDSGISRLLSFITEEVGSIQTKEFEVEFMEAERFNEYRITTEITVIK